MASSQQRQTGTFRNTSLRHTGVCPKDREGLRPSIGAVASVSHAKQVPFKGGPKNRAYSLDRPRPGIPREVVNGIGSNISRQWNSHPLGNSFGKGGPSKPRRLLHSSRRIHLGSRSSQRNRRSKNHSSHRVQRVSSHHLLSCSGIRHLHPPRPISTSPLGHPISPRQRPYHPHHCRQHPRSEITARQYLDAIRSKFGRRVDVPFEKETFRTSITDGIGVYTTRQNKQASVLELRRHFAQNTLRTWEKLETADSSSYNPTHAPIDPEDAMETLYEQLAAFRDNPDGTISGPKIPYLTQTPF